MLISIIIIPPPPPQSLLTRHPPNLHGGKSSGAAHAAADPGANAESVKWKCREKRRPPVTPARAAV